MMTVILNLVQSVNVPKIVVSVIPVTILSVLILINELLKGNGVLFIVCWEVLLMDLSKSVYTFVHIAYYYRKVSCSQMVKDAQLLYRELFTTDLLQYAVNTYKSFSDKEDSNENI